MRGRDVLTSFFLTGIFLFHLPPTLDIPLAKENRTCSMKNVVEKAKIVEFWQIRASSAQISHLPCTFRAPVQIPCREHQNRANHGKP